MTDDVEEDPFPKPHPLQTAAFDGELETVRRLLAEGVSPDVAPDGASTALHLAVENARLDVVRLLVEAGADVNDTSPGCTPLYRAVGGACDAASQVGTKTLAPTDVEVICHLLRSGADPSIGESPGKLAMGYDRHGLGRFLRVLAYLAQGCSTEKAAVLVPGVSAEQAERYFAFVAGDESRRAEVMAEISGW